MNIILFNRNEVSGNQVEVSDRRAEHIRTVLKARAGDQVRIGIINGPKGTGLILKTTANSVRLAVSLEPVMPPRPGTDLIVALPRPIMLKRLLKQAAGLGVGRIFLINAARVEKSFFQTSLLRDDSHLPFLREGLEQAADTLLPELQVFRRFRPFAEDRLPTLVSEYHLCLAAHPEGERLAHARTPVQPETRVMIAIGPEGGWIDVELDLFRNCGFSLFSLGPRIIRVDTVLPYILGQIDLLRHSAWHGPNGTGR